MPLYTPVKFIDCLCLLLTKRGSFVCVSDEYVIHTYKQTSKTVDSRHSLHIHFDWGNNIKHNMYYIFSHQIDLVQSESDSISNFGYVLDNQSVFEQLLIF